VKTEAPLLPGFKLVPTFFGLKPSDRVELHENLFNLIWFGEGRWDWNTIYNMPVHIRALWTRKVNQIIAMRNAPTESSSTTTKQPKIVRPTRTAKSA
jgi:hypothetical protein